MADDKTVTDTWDLPDVVDNGVKWSELSTGKKWQRAVLCCAKVGLLVGLLYLFICSLGFMADTFKLLGGKAAGEAFQRNALVENPIAGVMLGILATVLVQSSSTSTSIVVAMIAGDILTVEPAIPIIMGSNIGTSITNTLVSIGHSSNRDEFRRAFAGATIHDMFNLLTVVCLLPIEMLTHYLLRVSSYVVKSFKLERRAANNQDLLKVVTDPFAKMIIQIDKSVITRIAKNEEGASELSLVKRICEHQVVQEESITLNATTNATSISVNEVITDVPCNHLFATSTLSDTAIGGIMLCVSLLLLCLCLILIVKILQSIFRGRVASMIKKTLNSSFPGKLSFLTGYVAILIGAGITILVQSSSIFTSTMTPLVGIGVLRLDRMYPLTLGSNIGTTATAMLASLAIDSSKLEPAIQIALCHLFFNVTGILIWYPVPLMRNIPIKLAKSLGNTTAEYKWFAVFYLFVVFGVIPVSLFLLSLAGLVYFCVVTVPLAILALSVAVVNVIQAKRPSWLPKVLRDWSFLPLCLHSLRPIDRVISKVTKVCSKIRRRSRTDSYNSKLDVDRGTGVLHLKPVNPAQQSGPADDPLHFPSHMSIA